VGSVTNLPELRGWIPGRIVRHDGSLRVEWIFLPEKRFSDPFFEGTLQAAMRRPFNLLFRHNTSMEALQHWAQFSPGIFPTGFIFHVSRCGSTLVSWLLSKLESALVLSEPVPLDAVIRANFRNIDPAPEQQIAWLRAMVSALGQRRSPEQEKLFIKFDAWNMLQFPLLHAAFPDVPWIFLYREPTEVLVSSLRRRGLHTLPGGIEPTLSGFTLEEASRVPAEEYCARVLARIYQAGLQYHVENQSLLVNYTQLPEAIWGAISRHFHIDLTNDEISLLRECAQLDPKTTAFFSGDSQEKRAEATPVIQAVAGQWLYPIYHQLEKVRQRSDSN
jgi:hypothetical protein